VIAGQEVEVRFPPGWLLLTPAAPTEETNLSSDLAEHLASIHARMPEAVLIGWLQIPLEKDDGSDAGSIVASVVGAWRSVVFTPPAPLRVQLDGLEGIGRCVLEEPVVIGGIESVWLQATYDIHELVPGATFMLVFATPNLPLAETLLDYFDQIARTVLAPTGT
jgi:hypothetical protein